MAQPAYAEQSLPMAADPMSSAGRVLFVLAGMIALILVLAYWAKRLQNMSPSLGQGQHIKTLSVSAIGIKEKVALIEVGGQQLLVGITPHSIQTLLVLDTPIDIDNQPTRDLNFQNVLKKALNKK